MLQKTEIKGKSIENHQHLLRLFSDRNRAWRFQSNDPKIKETHSKIINLLEETVQKYGELLDLLIKHLK